MKTTIINHKVILNDTDLNPLISALSYFHPQHKNVIQYFRENLLSFAIKKGSLLQKAGDICKYIYFIKKGVLRGFILESKKDITTWVSVDNEMVTSISGLGIQLPARENIEAIEHSELLAITIEAMDKLYIKYPEFNITGRKLLEQYYRDAEIRAFISRLSSAEARYLFFLENYPHLTNRIQLGYIASFLGITLETLSRVRKKLSLAHG